MGLEVAPGEAKAPRLGKLTSYPLETERSRLECARAFSFPFGLGFPWLPKLLGGSTELRTKVVAWSLISIFPELATIACASWLKGAVNSPSETRSSAQLLSFMATRSLATEPANPVEWPGSRQAPVLAAHVERRSMVETTMANSCSLCVSSPVMERRVQSSSQHFQESSTSILSLSS